MSLHMAENMLEPHHSEKHMEHHHNSHHAHLYNQHSEEMKEAFTKQAAAGLRPMSKSEQRAVKKRMRKATKAKKKQAFLDSKNPVKDFVIYCVFLTCFSMLTIPGLSDTDVFYFGENLRGQLLGVEFREEHSPTFGKNFEDMATVEEFYQWLHGPFVFAVFSSHTFDGRDDYSTQRGNETLGYTLGQNKIIGGVRIGQIRAKDVDCNKKVPEILTKTYNWTCYGGPDGRLGPHQEDKNDFGEFGEWDLRVFNASDPQTWSNANLAAVEDLATLNQMRELVRCRNNADDYDCEYWAAHNQCQNNSAYMADACAHACGTCAPTVTSPVLAVNTSGAPALRGALFVAAGEPSEWSMTRSHGPFRYTGQTALGEPLELNIETQRKQYMSSYRTKKFNWYATPGYAVTLKPSIGEARATELVQDLIKSQFIDLHTRAVFVDMTIYNPMIDRICNIRLVGELTRSGGLMPTSDFEVMRLWSGHTSWDQINFVLIILVAAFYFYFAVESVRAWWILGWQFWGDFLNIAQVLNIVFFVSQFVANSYALTLVPKDVPVDSWVFTEFWPSVRFKSWATRIQAVNTFLNWFKLIAILDFAPQFGIMSATLGRSAKPVANFMVIFGIIWWGFAQAHVMIFNSRMEEFRDVWQSCFTLMRSLLGDFDFDELQYGHWVMGPLLFIIFVVLAVFVVLNMLIAIISESYADCKEELESKDNVNILGEVKAMLVRELHAVPCVGPYFLKRAQRRKEAKEAKERAMMWIDVDSEDAEDLRIAGQIDAQNAAAGKAGASGGAPTKRTETQTQTVLMEWYESLQSNESEFTELQAEMNAVQQDVRDMQQEFVEGMNRFMLVLAEATNSGKVPSLAGSSSNQDSHEQGLGTYAL